MTHDTQLQRLATASALRRIGAAFALAVLAAGSGAAWAAGARGSGQTVDREARAEINARYQRELAACKNGTSTQHVLSACLNDARGAYEEALRGTLTEDKVDPENAMRRCEALKGSDRVACRERMEGKGTVSGSVAGGGVLRELVTVEPVLPASTVPPAQPAASQPAR